MVDLEVLFPATGLLGRLLRLPLRLIPPNLVVWILSGKLRGYRWIVGASTHGCWLGTYEKQAQDMFVKMIEEYGSEVVVFDIGANAGFYTLLAHSCETCRKIYSFEPNPRNIAILRRHIELNKIANVELIPKAVGEFNGTSWFNDSMGHSEGKLAQQGSFEVRVATLDSLECGTDIDAPQFIKIDVEGAELSVLKGGAQLLRKFKPSILLSTHGDELNKSCSDWLCKLGYRVSHPKPDVILALNATA